MAALGRVACYLLALLAAALADPTAWLLPSSPSPPPAPSPSAAPCPSRLHVRVLLPPLESPAVVGRGWREALLAACARPAHKWVHAAGVRCGGGLPTLDYGRARCMVDSAHTRCYIHTRASVCCYVNTHTRTSFCCCLLTAQGGASPTRSGAGRGGVVPRLGRSATSARRRRRRPPHCPGPAGAQAPTRPSCHTQ